MGYRTYIGLISKEKYEEVKDMSRRDICRKFDKNYKEEWDDSDLYVGIYDIVEESYEFGKYTDFDDEKFYKPFFTNKETHEYYIGDHDCWVVGKEYLEHIIKHYRKKIEAYYDKMVIPFWGKKFTDSSEFIKSMKREYTDNLEDKFTLDFSKITPEEQTALWETLCHVRSMRSEWVNLNPYDLENGDQVTTSWKFEYNIFELVRLYKTIDWENNVLVYYGY